MPVLPSYAAARLAAAVFFFGPGVVYGLFSSRFPYFCSATGSPASAVGLVLLAIGAASLAGLSAASRLTGRFGCAGVLRASTVFMVLALMATAFSQNTAGLIGGSALIGLGMGLTDFTMNIQGLEVEKRYHRSSMNTLHAFYSLGGLAGSIFGSLFAAFGIGPAFNYLLPMALFLAAVFWASPKLLPVSDDEETNNAGRAKTRRRRPPLLLIGFGFLAMLAFEAEGAVGDWGSLFLMAERGADEATAALVYGSIAGTALLSRLAADRIREKIGNFSLLISCALLSAAGMLLVVLVPQWQAALIGFGAAGLGIGPISPVLFSIAGRIPGVSAGQASGVISFFAYSGLLMCPPLLGLVVGGFGLGSVMTVILGSTVVLTAGTLLVRCVK